MRITGYIVSLYKRIAASGNEIGPCAYFFFLASHAGVFRGARFSSLPKHGKGMLFSVEQAFVGKDEKRAPLKTPTLEANFLFECL